MRDATISIRLVPFMSGVLVAFAIAALGIVVHSATAAADAKPTGGIIRRYYQEFTVQPGQVGGDDAVCPKGQVAISGGYALQDGADVYVTASAPTRTRGWVMQALVPNKIQAPSARPTRIKVVVYCAPLGLPILASVADG